MRTQIPVLDKSLKFWHLTVLQVFERHAVPVLIENESSQGASKQKMVPL
jgi:hypothetical protein